MIGFLDNIPLLCCLVYLCVSLLVGLVPGISSQDRQAKGFVAANGGMGTTLLFFVLGASIFSSLAFIGAPAMAYSSGAAAFVLVATGILGPVPFFLSARQCARRG